MKHQTMQSLGLSGAALLVAASVITANAQTNQNVGSSQANTIPTGTISYHAKFLQD
ncbi:MAG: hypothetical protein ACLQU3_14150 [Limisphaerales bacterium]